MTALKVQLQMAAVGREAGVVKMNGGGTVASAVGSGNVEVRCVALDDVAGDPPTYVKMDVEGYELEALAGLRRTMAMHPPILAVTCYHAVDHLWKIPNFIHSVNPDYRLHLRRYAEDCWETVCYAVPPGRSLSA